MDEAELIAGCRRGERDAQRQLYERFVERIYRLTRRLSGNDQDAFDLTQDTFVRAFQGIEKFDGRAGVGSWLYRIATNEAFQLFRRRGVERRHLRSVAEQASEQAASGNDSSRRRDIEEALAQLSDQHRAVLILKYQEGLSYEELAEVLDCPPGTVASRLNRARAELREIMGGESPTSRKETDRLRHQT